MVEHAAVNRRVVGSSPTSGANSPLPVVGSFFISIHSSSVICIFQLYCSAE